ncbi:MAG: ArsC/Spx/MgsR family protein [Pseudomonadota bacterium]
MSVVLFYEKPGCATNAMQKTLLRAAGLRVVERDLLSERWSAERLRAFFAGLPVREWFNSAAPAIRSGAIRPTVLGAEQALAKMLADPILIRRPLIEVGERRFVGFSSEQLSDALGGDWPSAARVESCLRSGDGPCVLSVRRS